MTAGADSRADRLTRWQLWLDARREAPLDPARRIVDPHHHLWDRGGHTYLLDAFRRDTAANHLLASVYVECRSNYRTVGPPELQPVGETEFVAEQCSGHAGSECEVQGIVGFADLALGERVDAVLDAHLDAAPTLFKGVRYSTAWDADPSIHGSYPTRSGMLLEPQVMAGASRLAMRGLSLDVWLYFHQLDDALQLARAHPELSLIIDHCGGPLGIGRHAGRREAVFSEWRRRLQAFGASRNVTLKFGGLAMPLAGFGWKNQALPPTSADLATAWRPYYEVCLEVFGAQRCMFESNFPVDRSGCSYTALWNAFEILSNGASAEERDALFEGTARRVYRLESAVR